MQASALAREWRQMSARHANEARLWEALASRSGDCGWAHSYYMHQAPDACKAALAQADAFSTAQLEERSRHKTKFPKCPYEATQATAKMV